MCGLAANEATISSNYTVHSRHRFRYIMPNNHNSDGWLSVEVSITLDSKRTNSCLFNNNRWPKT